MTLPLFLNEDVPSKSAQKLGGRPLVHQMIFWSAEDGELQMMIHHLHFPRFSCPKDGSETLSIFEIKVGPLLHEHVSSTNLTIIPGSIAPSASTCPQGPLHSLPAEDTTGRFHATQRKILRFVCVGSVAFRPCFFTSDKYRMLFVGWDAVPLRAEASALPLRPGAGLPCGSQLSYPPP